MSYKPDSYISQPGVYWPTFFERLKKSVDSRLPIFEAITNSLEAIWDKKEGKPSDDVIEIILRLQKSLLVDGPTTFESLQISDTGKGFDDTEFDRFLKYMDTRKGHSNRGSGRFQIIHAFSHVNYDSTFKFGDGFRNRVFRCSNSKEFLKHEAVVYLEKDDVTSNRQTGTTLTLKSPKVPNDFGFYNTLTLEKLKSLVVSHYILLFGTSSEKRPRFKLICYLNGTKVEDYEILKSDLPFEHKTIPFQLSLIKKDSGGGTITTLKKSVDFELISIKAPRGSFDSNRLLLTSKGEVIDSQQIKSKWLPKKELVSGFNYLFLLSSDYLNSLEGDVRGNITIRTKKQMIDDLSVLITTEISLDDLVQKVEDLVFSNFVEFQELKERKEKAFNDIKETFYISDDLLRKLKISIDADDTPQTFLEKFYSAQAQLDAKKDADFKRRLDVLRDLDPDDPGFQEDISKLSGSLTKSISLQDRSTLAHYVARRGLVLDVFQQILNKKLKVQKEDKRDSTESLLHSLFFPQNSTDHNQSNLWLFNEESVYFSGVSNKRLKDILIDGQGLMKSDFTEEEAKYQNTFNKDKLKRKPDIILFPQEGKCIILEFKSPEVEVSRHLTQINDYASIILNLSNNQFIFKSFYGFLVGEKINMDDIINRDSFFVQAPELDYVFKPYYPIIGKFGRSNASLYTEVISYSTLLERAKNRNRIFIEKLGFPLDK